MKFEVSDWVQGRSAEGEFIHGYIETLDALQGIAKVRVIQSDNESAAGKLIAVRNTWLRKLPDSKLDDAGQIRSLIDVALAVRDEVWFRELSESLNAAPALNRDGDDDFQTPPGFVNRLGIYGKM